MIVVVACSFFTTAFFCLVLIILANKFKVFDQPDEILKNHKEPIPFFGGLALCVSSAIILYFILGQDDYLQFFGAVLPFFLLGIIDDYIRLSPMKKFLLQILAAIIFLHFLKLLFLPFFKIAVLIFGIVLIVNALNLVDVSDGLSSSIILPILLFFTGSFAIIAFGSVVTTLAQVLLGAVLGFLVFNWPKAKLFLGDSGIFFLSSAILFLMFKSGLALAPVFLGAPLVAIFLCGVPLAEVFNLVIIRTRAGIPFFLGSQHHFVHFLRNQGLSNGQAAFFAGSTSFFLSAISALVLYQVILLVPAFIFVSLGFFLWSYLVYAPSKPLQKLLSVFNRFKS